MKVSKEVKAAVRSRVAYDAAYTLVIARLLGLKLGDVRLESMPNGIATFFEVTPLRGARRRKLSELLTQTEALSQALYQRGTLSAAEVKSVMRAALAELRTALSKQSGRGE